MSHDHDIDLELGRLRDATVDFRPSDGFADRVMAAVAEVPEVGLIDVVGRWGRWAVAAAAMAAAAASFVAVDVEQEVNAEVISTFEAVEVSP